MGSRGVWNGCETATVAALALVCLHPTTVVAAGVVGSGTAQSCTETLLDAALAGGGMVTFDCGTNPVTIMLSTEKVITSETTVDGGGSVTLSGGNAVRVFNVSEGAALTVENITIVDGFGSGILNAGTLAVTNSVFSRNVSLGGGGGAISNGGTATVMNSTLSGNSAGFGGGIHNGGVLTVENCTVNSNNADYPGGGINNLGGTVTVTNSTFSRNSAGCFIGGGGGGIASAGGPLTVTNSTFSGNSTSICGGGGIVIEGGGTLTVTNSTFSDNSSGHGGGISGAGTITNSTFSGNSADTGGALEFHGLITNTMIANSVGPTCSGPITDGGHNLIEDAANSCGLVNGVNGNIVGVDSMLDPDGLQDNGGPTQTIALLPDSPAIDAGDREVCAKPPVNGLDQRGYARPGMGSVNCSIGAFEYNSSGPPLATATATAPGTPSVTPTPTARATFSPSGTATTRPSDGGDGGCSVTPSHMSGAAWWLFVPAVVLAWRQRRKRGCILGHDPSVRMSPRYHPPMR